MRGVFSFSLVAVSFLLSSARTFANELQSNASSSKCKPYPPSGMPGIPGTNGIPGIPGSPGRDGFKGKKGTTGKRGLPGTIGIPGKSGPRGPEGTKGEKGGKGDIGPVGIKGSSGIPGTSGPRGPKGLRGESGIGTKGEKGRKGEIGSMGIKGRAGIPGTSGPRGPKGLRGESGIGTKGEKGLKGEVGPVGTKGSKGYQGSAGIRGYTGARGPKGSKGDAANIDPRQLANWKQCAWKGLEHTDNGKIKECSFNKLHSNTALRVSYQGNVQVYTNGGCNRWYFKFDGNECSGPTTIESVNYNNWKGGLADNYRNGFFEGYCENLARGTVRVELWVGECYGKTQGNAYTGWNSVSRIMIEEVPPSQ
ncbi:uncharacterized protein LOC144629070 isoform X5 [Oculina patagonica]